MKKILLSILSIAVVGGVAFGATRAFFSDTETSTANVFAAGAIDLQIDNESYYNGVFNQGTSWELTDPMGLFFDFDDVKPGDLGEDTVSIHVSDNDAWACANITITEDIDNGCTEPEIADGDPQCTLITDLGGVGELSQNLNFIFWADDGDNALEVDEQVLTQGPASNVLNGVTWTIADSVDSIFTNLSTDPETDGALIGDETYYIGKAWCFGDLEPSPVPNPEVIHSPTTDPGVACNGTSVNNQAQTDRLMGDISFTAVQARNNLDFTCQN